MHDDHVKISVLIAGRSYPLKIKTSEEKRIQAVVDRVESCITDLKSKYPQKDAQDYLAMTLLTLGSEFIEENKSLEAVIDKKLESIEGLLNEMTE